MIAVPAKTAALLGAAVAVPALLLAACGTSSGSPAAGGSGSSAAQSSTSASSAKVVTVEAHSGAVGTFLTDGSGRTLYLFAKDATGKSSCSGDCTEYWPPLTTAGAPAASGAAKASMLATITRPDGSKQVTYGGHPLYYFAGDAAAGDLKGQGTNGFGAKWWVVSPAGASITMAASGSGSSPSSPTKSSGGGGGWG